MFVCMYVQYRQQYRQYSTYMYKPSCIVNPAMYNSYLVYDAFSLA